MNCPTISQGGIGQFNWVSSRFFLISAFNRGWTQTSAGKGRGGGREREHLVLVAAKAIHIH